MSIYIDYTDIDAQINNILNRNPAGLFSSVGDISDSADKRYSDDLITESRRKAAYRIFEAIGSNPSHPYWADLMAYYAVDHNAPIPVHFGEIGIPVIAANDYEIESHATGSLSVVGNARATGSLTVVNPTQAFATGYLTVSTPSGYSTGTLTIRQGYQATGTLYIQNLPLPDDTINIGGITFTFKTSGSFIPSPGSTYIEIQATMTSQAAAIAAFLKAYSESYPLSNVAKASYTSIGRAIYVVHNTYGTVGNTFVFIGVGGTGVSNVRVLATPNTGTLSGGVNGVQEGEIIYVNGFKCVWSDGPSDDVLYIGSPESNNAGENAIQFANALNGSAVALILKASFSPNEETAVVTATHVQAGAIGNIYELTDSDLGAITKSAATLTGGTGGIVEGETITIYTVPFTFSNILSGSSYLRFSSVGDPVESAALICEDLTKISSGNIFLAAYTPSQPPPPEGFTPGVLNSVKITYKTPGVGGNSYSLNNSSGSGVVRSGTTLTGGFTTGLAVGSTINVNGVSFAFVAGAPGAGQIQIGGSINASASNIAAALTASVNPLLTIATYTALANVVRIEHIAPGTSGNTFTIASSLGANPGAVAASASTLTGGGYNITESESITINGREFFFSYLQMGPGIINPDTTPELSAIAIANHLNASTYTEVTPATYTANGVDVEIEHDTQGVIGNSFTLATSDAGSVSVSGATLTGGGVVNYEKYLTAVPADPDWIDSARLNLLGTSSDYFGTGRLNHDGDVGSGIPSPLAGRYATPNGVFKFTGAVARIPMIKVPSGTTASTVVTTGVCQITADSGTITTTAASAAHVGKTIIVTDSLDVVVITAVITSAVVGVSYSIAPHVSPITDAVCTYSIETITATEAEVMADTKIPYDLASLNVKLALPLCVKEGDNAFKLAQWLGSEGERDLMLIKAGAVKTAPIDLVKLSQVGQKWSD